MKISKILLTLLFCSSSLFAADIRPDLAVSQIPDSLKKNAYGVVRSATTLFEYKSVSNGIQKELLILTVLDKKGKEMANFNYTGDKFRELTSLSLKLYDANGIFLRKYGISDIKKSEWTDSHTLAQDVEYYSLTCESPVFPFTAVFEYEVNWKNGLLVFPSFFPQDDYNLSLEKANYSITLPENVEFQHRTFNLTDTPTKTSKKGNITYEWKAVNLKSIESEPLNPDFRKFVPLLYIRPVKFVYDKVEGEISDWKSYGKWEYELIKDRDILTEETKIRLNELTKDAKNEREKVKILYDYLGKTTRYVSIQLGIGGYQPMFASEVCKTGFGDCKALSNYLKAMLSAVGVKSFYAGIESHKTHKQLYADFPNFNQMNHVILQVPLPGDTIWLECTNPRVPFGFVHNNIAGHDALVITPEGGKIHKLPDYPDSLNVESFKATVEISANGSAKIKTRKSCHAKIYDNNDFFPLQKPSEQADALRKEIQLSNVVMGNIEVKEDKSVLPVMNINYMWSSSLIGTKTGNRLFIPVNPFRTTYEGLKKSKRIHDIVIQNGFVDADSISFVLPEGFVVESIPAPVKVETAFGSFISEVKITGKKADVIQNVFMKTGQWNVTTYPDFIGFIDKISAGYKAKIIVRQN